ncbi:MAG: SRPBCC domain-containing protein [Anaerolineae bacterium]|nr:SRPBCC domain-containing protein [Anaerolineae bacterium]
MSTDPTAFTLKLHRTFNAPREFIFRAWTEPTLMQQWYCPNPAWGIKAHSAAMANGTWQVAMLPAEGDPYVVAGTYHEVTPPSRLVFTWRWVAGDESIETLVTVDLSDLSAETTELTLIHERFSDQQALENHEQGWSGCFDRLATLQID